MKFHQVLARGMALGMVALTVAATRTAQADILYSNLNEPVGLFSSFSGGVSKQIGDEVVLQGGEWSTITGFSFEFYAKNVSPSATYTVSLYDNDGAASPGFPSTPGTLLWSSSYNFGNGSIPLSLLNSGVLASYAAPDFDGGLTLTNDFTWAIRFSNLGSEAGVDAGLILSKTNGAITVGANYNDYWLNNGAPEIPNWVADSLPGASINFLAAFSGTAASAPVSGTKPVGGTHFLETTVSTALVVSISTLANLDDVPGGDPLTITAVSGTSTNGIAVTMNATAGTITYGPSTYVGSDQFTYTIKDVYTGGTATSTADVTVSLGNSSSVFNSISGTIGNMNLRGYGIPTHQYDIQRSSDPTFPGGSTSTLATITAAASGVILYTDTDLGAPNPSYYRLAVH
jgi:hypothetical protein